MLQALLKKLTDGPFVPVVEPMTEMIWLGDAEGRCLYLNRALREFWGVRTRDLPRFSWDSTLLEDDQGALFAVVGDAMARKSGFTVRARYRRADGAVRVLETQAEPRFAPNGEFLGMVGVNTDVTDEGAEG